MHQKLGNSNRIPLQWIITKHLEEITFLQLLIILHTEGFQSYLIKIATYVRCKRALLTMCVCVCVCIQDESVNLEGI